MNEKRTRKRASQKVGRKKNRGVKIILKFVGWKKMSEKKKRKNQIKRREVCK